jgi:hypothetical protein
MSLHLRLAVGPVVLIDCELFRVDHPDTSDEPPPQLNGGQGTVLYPEPTEPAAFGFGRRA